MRVSIRLCWRLVDARLLLPFAGWYGLGSLLPSLTILSLLRTEEESIIRSLDAEPQFGRRSVRPGKASDCVACMDGN